MIDYYNLYDQLMELHDELHDQININHPIDTYQEIQGLGAVYTLLDYVSRRIASFGERPEWEDFACEE